MFCLFNRFSKSYQIVSCEIFSNSLKEMIEYNVLLPL